MLPHLILIGTFWIVCKASIIENHIIFEKLEYQVVNRSFFLFDKVEVKPIAHNVYKANITVVLTAPLNRLWMRFVLYHKYTTYQKYLIDIWEDFCGFAGGSISGQVINLIFNNFKRLGTKFYFELKCPLRNTLMITHDGMNISQVVLPLLGAGRYRLDMHLATGRGKGMFALIQFFASVSDIRVWH